MHTPPERKRGPALAERSPEKSAFSGTGTHTDSHPKVAAQDLFSRIAITSERVADPERILPNVEAARLRNLEARQRIARGISDQRPPHTDFAAAMAADEQRKARRRHK